MPLTFICLASYFKGEDFLRSAKKCGCTVFLVTSKKHEDKAWPRESIDEIFYVQEDENDNWDMPDVIAGTAWLMRSRKVDRIVALDDFDVEKAALLREHFRIPGMGQTTARYFRDKLAMRFKAAEAGIPVPAFTALFNDAEIRDYTARVSAPWVLKPRAEASATGIQKIHSAEQLWEALEKLGNDRHNHLLEQFRPGHVYHADALTVNEKVVFCRVSQYLAPPMEVAHGGGIFRSMTLQPGSRDEKALQKLNIAVMKAFGMHYSASHTEFIQCHEDGQFYFLETASRVGGAHLAEMVESATGINLWAEWARLETAVALGEPYVLPPVRTDQAGIIVSLARQQWPDLSPFGEPEVCWRMHKEYHVGVIVRSPQIERVRELLDTYAERVRRDFHASAPAKDKPDTDRPRV
jgi:hypothetical protein